MVPIEQIIFASSILIWSVIITLKRMPYDMRNKKAHLYFILAIGLGAITNFSVILSETTPIIYGAVTSIINIFCYTIYSTAFYLLIKEQENF